MQCLSLCTSPVYTEMTTIALCGVFFLSADLTTNQTVLSDLDESATSYVIKWHFWCRQWQKNFFKCHRKGTLYLVVAFHHWVQRLPTSSKCIDNTTQIHAWCNTLSENNHLTHQCMKKLSILKQWCSIYLHDRLKSVPNWNMLIEGHK